MNPINGLEIANQSEAASRRRQARSCVVFTRMIFLVFDQATNRSWFGAESPSNSARRDS